MGLTVSFWGVRGSIAVPSPRHVRYGGNTSCLEVQAGEDRIILDAGTGIRNLGQRMVKEPPRPVHLLLTHTHWDHINGFPFFQPFYTEGRAFRVMAGHLSEKGGVKRVLAGQMVGPVFPVPLETLRADFEFVDFRAGETFELTGGAVVRTAELRHPDGATAYRIEYDGRSLCYVTDTEHIPGAPDENILRLIAGADLVIYDCTYTDDELPAHLGWGHSTWQEGVRLCKRAGVKKLVIYHHDPSHDDEFMDEIAKQAAQVFPDVVVASEGMRLEV